MEKRVSLRKRRLVSRELKDFCSHFLVKLKPQTDDTGTFALLLSLVLLFLFLLLLFCHSVAFLVLILLLSFTLNFPVGMPNKRPQLNTNKKRPLKTSTSERVKWIYLKEFGDIDIIFSRCFHK